MSLLEAQEYDALVRDAMKWRVMGEKIHAGYTLTAKLCALPIHDEGGNEYLNRSAVMDEIARWRRVMDGK